MAKLPKVDVVFVGFGLTGGVVANELSKRTKLKMVALERGPFRTTGRDFLMDHFDEWRYAFQAQLFQDLSRVTLTFRNDSKQTALPMRQYGSFRPGNEVGGAMVHWNGATWRFLDYFFTYRTHLEQRYGKDFLPEDCFVQDWGITWDDIEPYYTQFDQYFGIAGKAGNLKGQIQPGGNPFEGPRSEDYPQGPNKIAYGPSLFREATDEIGFHPFPQPTANSPAVYTNPDGQKLGACEYCGFCERFGCHTGAKASPIVTVIPNALKSGRVEVRPYSNVFRINHENGVATSVSYYDATGDEQEQPADIIVVGAFTLENIRLALLSKIGEPYDPSTGKGVTGRNYSYQLGGASAQGWYDDRILNRFMGSGANGFVIDDFNSDSFDHSGLGFFGGGSIACNNTGARPIGQSGPLPPGTARWGSDWKAAIKQYYNRVVSFGMQGESPSWRQNYCDLDPTYKDSWGNPLLRMTFNWTDNERKIVRYVAETALTQIISKMGPAVQKVNDTITDYSIVPYQSTHCTGGVIMGSDPSTSAVNPFNQAWDVQNVFICGASSFPQNAGYNPTGTVGALAYRLADTLVSKYIPNPGALA
jgi:gluconate 2-dehydrogenase alpha chain